MITKAGRKTIMTLIILGMFRNLTLHGMIAMIISTSMDKTLSPQLRCFNAFQNVYRLIPTDFREVRRDFVSNVVIIMRLLIS